ncbi:MAG: zf-HC2 domain-containing protein [Deltaproteobacteria bacterium]|nr:zf-HC2 domain-containing protein [Deltaproteobacteria bacterium]
MSIDCEQMDGLMMDFLYQELSADGLTTFQKHMEGCARCTQELARFQGVRSAVRDIGEAEPPAGVSARLIAEAAKQVAPSPARRAWVWLAALFGPLRAHPALASVAALALVIGVGGFLARRGFEGKQPEGTRAAIDDRMAESSGAGAPAPAAAPMEAASAGTTPEAMLDGDNLLKENEAPGAGGKVAAQRGQAGTDQGSLNFNAEVEEANKQAEAQRELAVADKTMADKSGAADGDADAERVARLRSTPVVVSGEGSASNGASKPGDLAAASKDSKNDTAEPRFATPPPPSKPAPEPVKRPATVAAPSPSPMAATPRAPRAAPTDDADGFANDEMAPPPGMVAPSGGMPPTMAAPDMAGGRKSTVAAPAPTSTGSRGGLGNTGPAPKQAAPSKSKVTVTSKPAGSPPVSNPMNLRDPKPMTPSQMQASADVKRRRGDCVGALPMYDEILRKYPSYAGKAAVTAGRETCLNELEGKLARKKSGGSSSAGSKAKAAPMPAREADMATDPASSAK